MASETGVAAVPVLSRGGDQPASNWRRAAIWALLIALPAAAWFAPDGDQWISLAEVFRLGVAFSSITFITGCGQIRDDGHAAAAVGFDVVNDGSKAVK
jgi:hypothetical protein